jgi:hypothetical protein
MTHPADTSATTRYGAGEADSDTDGDADGDSSGDADADGDGSAETEAGSDGSGTGVGSGMKRDGMPAMESTSTRTKMPSTVRIQGRASRSSREGSEPR